METGLFVLGDIKSRVLRHDAFVVGDGQDGQAFVTLNIQMLSGRDDAVKAAIGEAALRILVAAFPRTLAELKTSITVQISDIHRASYRRMISYSA
jgi:5-carboxymethyl-2-hydroxymuconate isomerase